MSGADEQGSLEQALLEGSLGEEPQPGEKLTEQIEQTRHDLAAKKAALEKLERTERELALERQVDPVTPDLQPFVEGGASAGPDAGVESVIPDLQPIVELGPGDPSTWQPAEPAPAAQPRIPGGPKTVVAGGVAAVAAVVAVLAFTLGGSGKSHASATPATTAAGAATTTTAPTTAPAPAPAAPVNEPPTVSPISARFRKLPPPKAPTDCPLGCLPVKPVTVRYTVYRVSASDPEGDPLTYRWQNTNGCGTFRATGPSARWDFPHPGSCPKTDVQVGTITVTVSDGMHTCTAAYPSGSAAGRGPKPAACKPT